MAIATDSINKMADVGSFRKTAALAALCLGFFMVVLDTTVVNVALPTIRHDLRSELDGLQWVVNSYTLIFASLLLTAGALGDRFGTKRLYTSGILVFTSASLLCGLAGTLAQLIGGRMLQGIGAAMLVPGSLSLITHAYPDAKQRARAVGIWAGVSGVSFASGPIIGGLTVDTFGWRSIFFLNIPVGLLALLLTLCFVNEIPLTKSRGVDLVGQILAIAGLSALSYALIEGGSTSWADTSVICSFLVFVIAAHLFLRVERANPDPMLNLSFFADSSFATANTVGFFYNFCLYGMLFVLSLFLQNQHNYSALKTGVAFLPLSVAGAVIPPLSGRLTSNVGPRFPMIIGLASSGLGALILSSVTLTTSYAAIFAGFGFFGVGTGMTMPAMTATVLASVPKERSGIASAVLNSIRQTGGVLGVALLGTLVSGRDFVKGMHIAMLIVAAAFAFSCFLTIVYLRPRQII